VGPGVQLTSRSFAVLLQLSVLKLLLELLLLELLLLELLLLELLPLGSPLVVLG